VREGSGKPGSRWWGEINTSNAGIFFFNGRRKKSIFLLLTYIVQLWTIPSLLLQFFFPPPCFSSVSSLSDGVFTNTSPTDGRVVDVLRHRRRDGRSPDVSVSEMIWSVGCRILTGFCRLSRRLTLGSLKRMQLEDYLMLFNSVCISPSIRVEGVTC